MCIEVLGAPVMKKLHIRAASMADLDTFFKWANLPEIRENSFHPKLIEFDEHVKWFTEKINDEKTIILIGSYGNQLIGQVRFEEKNQATFEIDIHIDSEFKGQGYGKSILSNSIQFIQENFIGHFQVFAQIFVTNTASIKTFKSCGFIENSSFEINSIECIEMIYKT